MFLRITNQSEQKAMKKNDTIDIMSSIACILMFFYYICGDYIALKNIKP